MGLLSQLGLKNLFAKEETYKASNALEQLMEQEIYKLDPRRFYEMFTSQTIYVWVKAVENSDDIGLLTASSKFGDVAHCYTSLEALKWSQKVEKLDQKGYITMTGLNLLEHLDEMGLGLLVNMSVGWHIIPMSIDNVRHTLSQIKNPEPVKSSTNTLPAGSELIICLPKVLPNNRLASFVEFLKQHPQIDSLRFGLIIVNDVPSYLLSIIPAEHGVAVHDIAQPLGQLWIDVEETTPGFMNFPLDMVLLGVGDTTSYSVHERITRDGFTVGGK